MLVHVVTTGHAGSPPRSISAPWPVRRTSATRFAPAAALALVTGLSAIVVQAHSAFAQSEPAAPARANAQAKTKTSGNAKTAAAKPAEGSGAAPSAAEKKALSASGQSIAVLVNDEPITGYEIQQRQRMMGLSANIQSQATENFKRMLQNPATSEKLKGILNDTINANKGKTKEQVIAIFEERKKQYALSLQKQAVKTG